MKLIQESMNGIRLVKYLANLKKGEIANAKDISREVGVPVKFALKILRILKYRYSMYHLNFQSLYQT